tara:strand:- start:4577 stop:5026 length:450 start_codon:yes stop_codon:yes gene_type:complete
MLTIIGSLIGFGSSFLPSVLDFFKQKEDNKQELALMDKQAELTRITAEFERDKAEVQALSAETVALYQQASTEKNDGWVGAYRASVRPTISYLFLLFYISIKSFALLGMIQYEGMMIKDALPLVWSNDVDSPILASIISFYFGSRMFRK